MTQSEVIALLRTAVYIVVGIPIPAGAAAAVFFLPHSRSAHGLFPGGVAPLAIPFVIASCLRASVFPNGSTNSAFADTVTPSCSWMCRRSETEADSIGMRLAAKACYDPSAAGAHFPIVYHVKPSWYVRMICSCLTAYSRNY